MSDSRFCSVCLCLVFFLFLLFFICFFFFFKQKTAYEMRISDWSSDVCSSDLDFVALAKPRVMSLVVFTGLAGLVAAPDSIHPLLGFVAVLCIALAAGAAGALNQWWEADTDALMKRTANRPLPSGRMEPGAALAFGVSVGTGSVLLMGLAVNWLSAAILAVSILYYVFAYTIWLTPRTPQNIVIGGAAGAFPPLIGGAAVTGDITAMTGLLF